MPANDISLSEAKALLASVGYRSDWTTEQLFAVLENFTRDEYLRFMSALEVTAKAAQSEADALEEYAQTRGPRQ